MGKKRYVKPEIREESYVLTVRAWVTTTSVVIQEATETNPIVERLAETAANVAAQQIAERIAEVVTR